MSHRVNMASSPLFYNSYFLNLPICCNTRTKCIETNYNIDNKELIKWNESFILKFIKNLKIGG
jgi:hypothetical protein